MVHAKLAENKGFTPVVLEKVMPLPSDEKIVQLANSLLAQLGAIFGLHPGFRPARAKGLMLSGTSTPSPEAVSLIARRTQRAPLLPYP